MKKQSDLKRLLEYAGNRRFLAYLSWVLSVISRIDGVLDEKPFEESKNPGKPADSSITFEHVSYSYDGEKNALEDVSLTIQAGETAALAGPSGGGKTALASLAAGFFRPQKGCIRIGGVNLCDIPREELMNTVSFVFQNSHLLKTSILENVRMAKPEAGREEVLKALDEATAFADPDNEVRVGKALTALSKGKTVLMIAHRLTSIVGADQIYILEQGKIAEKGTHKELLERQGKFAHMWKQYQQAAQWKLTEEAGL